MFSIYKTLQTRIFYSAIIQCIKSKYNWIISTRESFARIIQFFYLILNKKQTSPRIPRICENVVTQNLPFLSYYPHKITLFFLHMWLNRHNYTLKNGHQRRPTTLKLYVKVIYVENLYLSRKVLIFELCRCSRICAICPLTCKI